MHIRGQGQISYREVQLLDKQQFLRHQYWYEFRSCVVPHLKATLFACGSMGRADRWCAVFSALRAEKTAHMKM